MRPPRKKEIKIQWNDKDTKALIDFYNDKFVEIKKGNFKSKHWNQCVAHVNESKQIENDEESKT